MEQEKEKNVIDYMFYIIEEQTKNYTRALTDIEKMAIYGYALEIYGQCIEREIRRYDEWCKSQLNNNENN